MPTPIGPCSTLQQSQNYPKVSSLGGEVKRCHTVGVEWLPNSEIHIYMCIVARQ